MLKTVGKAKGKVSKALSMFQKAYDKIEQADEELKALKARQQEKISKAQSIVTDADTELEVNSKFKQKLSDFLNN